MLRFLLSVLAALLCLSVRVAAHSAVHPLSRVELNNIVKRFDGGVITIDASTLHGMGETINVTFSGMSSHYPGKKDWIGVWSPRPENGNYSTKAPSKYKMVTPDATGSGNVSMWLLNMRDSVIVAYFTGGLTNPVLLAESEPVKFENIALPMHVHLALTGNPSQMRIDWTSAQDANSKPWLRWGERAINLTNVVSKVMTTTHTAADMCGAPASTVGFRSPGFFHTAVLEGLKPNTRYFYKLGDSTPGSESAVYHFWSPAAPDAEDVQFVIFGDMGQVETDGSFEPSEMDGSIITTTALAADIEHGVVQLNASAAVFHIGDISYARGYVTIWEQFF